MKEEFSIYILGEIRQDGQVKQAGNWGNCIWGTRGSRFALQRMSGKRKKSSLSQSSASGSDLSDAGRQLEILASKKHKQANSG